MAFTIKEYTDFSRLLREHPEWQAELRRLLLTDDVLALPQEFRDLAASVRALAESQRRADERVAGFAERTNASLAALADAQRSTDQSVADLRQAMSGLAEAQRRTEQGLDELRKEVSGLAEAQRRTEQGLDELRKEVSGLADAQRRTDQNIGELRKEVGGLANIFGFRYEEFVAALLPPYLARHYGVSDLALERRYIDMGGGRFEEVDLVGEGQREHEPLIVLVECRASIGGSEMRNLAAKLDSVRGAMPAPNSARVVVAMNIHPSAEPVAQETGIWLIPYHKIDRERG